MNFMNNLITKSHDIVSPFHVLGIKGHRMAQNYLWQMIQKSLIGSELYKTMRLDCITNYRDYVKHFPVTDIDFYRPYLERASNGEKNIFSLCSISLPFLNISLDRCEPTPEIPSPEAFILNRNMFRSGYLLSFNDIENVSENLMIDEIKVGKSYLVNIGTPQGILNLATGKVVEIISIGKDIVFRLKN